MDQDHPRRRRRRRSGEDHISGLPDELLHSILLRLGSARAAARTCALSRRWRRVWAHLPELVFGSGSRDAPPLAPASFARGVGGVARSVDGALAAYAADTTLEGLVIVLPTAACDALDGVPAGRVARWLRFAAGRVAGELILFMPPPTMPPHEPEGVHWAALELPACERARTIALRLRLDWRLRLPPAGSFAALTSLTILFACMDGGELTAHVCTRCPCMRNLRLCLVLVDDHGVSIRSDSLRSLSFVARARWLEVVTPGLEYLCVGEDIGEARVSAPKLAGLVWSCHATYDPHRHRFEDAGRRRLQLLDIGETSAAGLLLRKFEGVEVDQLRLGVSIPLGIEAYKSFSNETSKLPKCQTLNITLLPRNCHGLAPVMLHLLRSCSSTKKVSVQLFDFSGYSSYFGCRSCCPCRLEESRRIDGIDLSSLEEVEITSHRSSQKELLEFVEQLCRCNAPILKKLVFSHTRLCLRRSVACAIQKLKSNSMTLWMGHGCVSTDYSRLIKIRKCNVIWSILHSSTYLEERNLIVS